MVRSRYTRSGRVAATAPTVAASAAAVRRGAWMVRVHDVAPMRHALAVDAAIEAAG